MYLDNQKFATNNEIPAVIPDTKTYPRFHLTRILQDKNSLNIFMVIERLWHYDRYPKIFLKYCLIISFSSSQIKKYGSCT